LGFRSYIVGLALHSAAYLLMKRRVLQFLWTFILIGSATDSFAQKENLDDLVPFRKGNKWGIVHHDGKEFYKPVFDTILPSESYFEFRLFQLISIENYVGQAVKVVMKEKEMWLKPDKSLVDVNHQRNQEENGIDEVWESKTVPPVVDEGNNNQAQNKIEKPQVLITYRQKNAVARVEKFRDSFFVYINDVQIPEFSSFSMQFVSSDWDSIAYLVVYKYGKAGLANLTTGKFSIPLEYNNISRLENTSFFYASKNGLTGIVAAEQSIILPVKYKALLPFINQGNKFIAFVVQDDSGFHFLELKNKLASESSVMYDYLIGPFSNGTLFMGRKKGLYGMVNYEDSVLVPFNYAEIKSSGRAWRFLMLKSVNNLYGFVDMENNFFRVEPVYTSIHGAMETRFKIYEQPWYLFFVTKNGRSYYVDNFGKEFIAK
jgi:hypothetical protein